MSPLHNHRLLLAAAAAVLPQFAAAATTFTFDGFTTNASIPDTWGDNVAASSTGILASVGAEVTGTPDIGITWQVAPVTVGTQYYNGWDGRGSVAQLDYTQPNTGGGISWLFTPGAASRVVVSSFDLDEWAGGGSMSVGWSITGPSSGTLASGTWTRSTGGRDTISPGVTGLGGEALTLRFVLNSGTGSYVALDNLVLDQVQIPEPLSGTIAALGLGAMAMRRRRQH